ncbi:sirohydrochlorin chelatase [Natronosporangium hydrolyticum]|uniref:Sirohydrochlorin chelatase n=1 Tax=Natronosporangium hydrolyticum TaxID=2811111 RepID=A0A895YQX7_9ACTN|nr:sirohydrochlorin chelatase [Natronosporangium hydrolyticum]
MVGVAHGTRDPRGAEATRALLARVHALAPELSVHESYVEITEPSLRTVLAAVPAPAVVVPLLLGAGYHVQVDLPAAITASGGGARLAPALGPHPLLALALHERLLEAGWNGEPVVLAAAGSSHRRPRRDAQRTAALLERRLGVSVRAAYASAARPTVAEAVAAWQGRAAVASYLLAPGFFHDRVVAAGARVTSAPLGDHDALAQLILLRYTTTSPAR